MVQNKIRCLLIACVVCLLAQPLSLGNGGADKTFQIGVRVNIPDIVHSTWDDTFLPMVRDEVQSELLNAVSGYFIHWDFEKSGDEEPPVLLTLDIVEERMDQLVVKLRLQIKKKPEPGSSVVEYKRFVLARTVWYEPGDMLSGVPEATATRNKLREFLRLTFPDDENDRTISLDADKLLEYVPLAKAPRWIEPREKSFILPLSKDRYSHLLWSRFRLRPKSGDPVQVWVQAKADDNWDSYDENMAEALIADMEEDSPPCDPNAYEPYMVYLLEYREDVGWDVF